MKNLLMLILIVLSPHIYAQNSIAYQENYFSTDLKNQHFEPNLFSVKKLVPVNLHSDKDIKKNWFIHSSIPNSEIETKDFSSMTLIDHMNELNYSTPFNVAHNATIERFIRVYLKDRREYINKIIGASKYYFPLFEQYLDKYELPLEIKYLAVVESALNPKAISSSGAKGLWQFMYGTGSDYNLYIDSYVDERFDPLKSTEAACLYLKKLHATFGDWDLALAAYNSGPGNVKKAIKRSGGKQNYWEIRKYLPRETRSYVPAFYATLYLFSYAEFHGLQAINDGVQYYNIDTLHVKGSLRFESIRNSTGVSIDLLKSLNPQYKKEFIPYLPKRTLTLSLPAEIMHKFLENEATLYAKKPFSNNRYSGQVIPVTSQNSHLVSKGENLHSIAQKYQISLNQLKIWNGLQTNFLIEGQRLVVIPTKETKARDVSISALHSDESYIHYTVLHGDTLFKISKKFNNISIAELRALNNLVDVNYLKPGMELKIKKINGKKTAMNANRS